MLKIYGISTIIYGNNKLTNTLTRLQNALFDIMEHIHRQNVSGSVVSLYFRFVSWICSGNTECPCCWWIEIAPYYGTFSKSRHVRKLLEINPSYLTPYWVFLSQYLFFLSYFICCSGRLQINQEANASSVEVQNCFFACVCWQWNK